ncbi:MAG: HAD hydrolase family protein, partial [Clostridia bacterium]|nr:HAD hydrolase family protein [Clostridia bacterium]
QFPVQLDVAREVLAYVDSLGVYSQYYSPTDYYIEKHCDFSEGYKKACFVEGIATGRPQHESISFDPCKILLIDTPERIRELREDLRGRWGDVLQIDISKPHYLEITDKKANKGEALRSLAAEMGVDLSETMVFGDALNDLSMFIDEWTCVAMGNACPELKEKADFITTDVEDDGIYRACEALGLFTD